MAGDERIMNDASMLMIHNAWNCVAGNAGELRKAANDLETISKTAANAYRANVNIDDDELQGMLNAETWITPAEAIEMGFATTVVSSGMSFKASQSARKSAYNLLTNGIIGADFIKKSVQERFETDFGKKPVPDKQTKNLFNFKKGDTK